MIIIADIHGRSFWKGVIKDRESEKIIFLGDYLDPYLYEEEFKGLNLDEIYEKTVTNFKEIIDLKKSNPDNVILLLGNHDCHYFLGVDNSSRLDYLHFAQYRDIFNENTDLFQMAYEKNIGGKRFIFSHAGISKNWLDGHSLILKGWNDDNIVEWVNEKYKNRDRHFIGVLNDISHYRKGFDWYGSMIWADFQEYLKDEDMLIGDFQIFGHTQLRDNPFVWNKFADLDCRRGFILNDDGNITELDGKILEKTQKPDE